VRVDGSWTDEKSREMNENGVKLKIKKQTHDAPKMTTREMRREKQGVRVFGYLAKPHSHV